MKQKILLTLIFLAIGTAIFAFVLPDVPKVVQDAFKAKFPGATSVKWEAENNKVYEADFLLHGNAMSASFTVKGAWLETKTEIKADDLPAAIHAAIQNHFEGYDIDEIEFVDHAKSGKAYEVELEKGDSELEILFSPEGKILKQESEVED